MLSRELELSRQPIETGTAIITQPELTASLQWRFAQVHPLKANEKVFLPSSLLPIVTSFYQLNKEKYPKFAYKEQVAICFLWLVFKRSAVSDWDKRASIKDRFGASLSALYLKKVHKQYLTYIKLFVDAKVLHCDGNYSAQGKKAKTYWLDAPFYREQEVTPYELPGKSALKIDKKKDSKKLSQAQLLRLRHINTRMTMDEFKARELINTTTHPLKASWATYELEKIVNHEVTLTTDDRGREYTQLTTLPKNMRELILIDGQPTKSYDIKTSQPRFFWRLLFNKYYEKNYKTKIGGGEGSPYVAPFCSLKDPLCCTFSDGLVDGEKMPYVAPFANSESDAEKMPYVAPFDGKIWPDDLMQYGGLIEAGILYEKLMELVKTEFNLNITRDEAKKLNCQAMFNKIELVPPKYPKRLCAWHGQEIYRKHWPSVWAEIKNCIDKKINLAHELTALEARYVFGCCEKITVPYYTVHDCIVVPVDYDCQWFLDNLNLLLF